MPPENRFIPEKYELVPPREASAPDVPVLISSTPNTELLFFKETQFKQPKVEYFSLFQLHESLLKTKKGYICLTLLIRSLKVHLREFLYLAEMANISCKINSNASNFQFLIKGYSDKFEIFLEELGKRIGNFLVPDSQTEKDLRKIFEQQKIKKMEEMEDFSKKNPYKQQSYIMSQTIYSKVFTQKELLIELQEMKFESYLQIHNQLFQKVFIETFVVGNVTQDLAKQMEESFLSCFRQKGLLKPLKLINTVEIRMIGLNRKQIIVMAKPVSNKKQNNHMMSVTFQLTPNKKKDCINSLLKKYLSSEYYGDLRSEQQLGYIVFAYSEKRHNVNMFTFLIQSTKLIPSELSQKTYEFLNKQRVLINNITETKFEEIKQGKIALLKQEFNSLKKKAEYFFDKIEDHNYNFKRKQEKLQITSALKKEDFISHFENMFYQEQRILELHLVADDQFKENDSHLRKRQDLSKSSSQEFENLELKIFSDREILQKDFILYPDPYLKKSRLTI